MAGDPKNPEVGEISVDATVCAAYAVDLEPGGMAGMLSEQEGVNDVVGEIKAHQSTWGDLAGITNLDFTTLVTAHTRIGEIDNLLPAARKLVEILIETRAQQDDIRERTIRSIAQSVDTRSRKKGNAALLAKYEKTRIYRSQIAMKGVKARKRNAVEKAAKNGNVAATNGAANGTQATAPKPPAPEPSTPQGGTPQPGNG